MSTDSKLLVGCDTNPVAAGEMNREEQWPEMEARCRSGALGICGVFKDVRVNPFANDIATDVILNPAVGFGSDHGKAL